jgi:transcriptional regulator GlxA family with amidase domain
VPTPILNAVRSAYRRGSRLISFCSGAFILAEAGILDGRRVTTHWLWAPALAARYPTIDVDPNVLYVDEGQILTSAGTAAAIDLALHVVRLDVGAEEANAVARRMVVAAHRDGGQAQFVDRPVPAPDEDDRLGPTLAWLRANPDADVPVDALAERANMSPRTFLRHFRATTGTTPHQWRVGQRLRLAQRLLETTDQSVERVAALSGFGTATSLRAQFRKAVGTSPLAYRRAFHDNSPSCTRGPTPTPRPISPP